MGKGTDLDFDSVWIIKQHHGYLSVGSQERKATSGSSAPAQETLAAEITALTCRTDRNHHIMKTMTGRNSAIPS
jgi:hypothetical protein